MKTILLGPDGQLGVDVQAANLRSGEPLSLIPVGRSLIDLSDIAAASRFLLDQDFQCLINCSSYHKTDEVERNAQLAFTINTHLVQEIAASLSEKERSFNSYFDRLCFWRAIHAQDHYRKSIVRRR